MIVSGTPDVRRMTTRSSNPRVHDLGCPDGAPPSNGRTARQNLHPEKDLQGSQRVDSTKGGSLYTRRSAFRRDFQGRGVALAPVLLLPVSVECSLADVRATPGVPRPSIHGDLGPESTETFLVQVAC